MMVSKFQGSANSLDANVNLVEIVRSAKRERYNYYIRADLGWLHGLVGRKYLGKSAPKWWTFPTNWLWEPPYSAMMAAELGALVKLISMFMRDVDAYNRGMFETHKKELKMHGISDPLLRRVCSKLNQLEISILTETGEIRDL